MTTALSMADIIQRHAAASSNGLSYAQMGRFAVESGDPAGTNNADEALKDANGKPVANAARNTQLTAASHLPRPSELLTQQRKGSPGRLVAVSASTCCLSSASVPTRVAGRSEGALAKPAARSRSSSRAGEL